MKGIIMTFLLVAAVIFGVYAWKNFYGAQPQDQSQARRALGAVIAAAASVGALVASWFQPPAAP